MTATPRASRGFVPLTLVLLITALLAVAFTASRAEPPAAVSASSGPSAGTTARPTLPPPTGAPTPRPTATPYVPEPPEVYPIAGWGITLMRDMATPWQAIRTGFDGNQLGIDVVADEQPYLLTDTVDRTAVDIFFGRCSDESYCAQPLITVSLARNGASVIIKAGDCSLAPPNWYIDCLISNDRWPISLKGSTLTQLKDAWLAEIGPATVSTGRLDGAKALVLDTGVRRMIVAIHAGIVVALITEQLTGETPEAAARAFDSAISSFHFVDETPGG